MAAFCSWVEALEPAWRGAIDAALARRRLPTTRDVARLGEAVSAMSAAYNTRGLSRGVPIEARLGFGFARDVPKSAGAVRELLGAGVIAREGPPLRVADVGAGLGATTVGVARALAAAGIARGVTATLYDVDRDALAVGRELLAAAKEADAPGTAKLSASFEEAPATAPLAGELDLVLLGQVMSELDRDAPAHERVARHAAWLGSLGARLADGGAIVVVEPALRDRTRHLHAVRDAVLAGDSGLTVFAPCLHAAPCPALEGEGDWCHEDLPVDLPDWLAPVARAAGLRHQGLSFSYLVLRRAPEALADHVGAGGPGEIARVVSDAMRTKGKREAIVCGPSEGAGARRRLRLLDRDGGQARAAWDSLRRGDVLRFTGEGGPPIDARGRITPHARIVRLGR